MTCFARQAPPFRAGKDSAAGASPAWVFGSRTGSFDMRLNLVNIGVRTHTWIAMERQQGYKFELIPTGAQARAMRRFAGSCRYVFNRALAQQNAQREILPD